MHLNVEMIVRLKKGVFKFQSKNKKFDEYKNCLDGNDYQKECDNFIFQSFNHEMYL